MDDLFELHYFDRLFDLLTDHKKNLFAKIVKQRTAHIAWLTENLYHEQNSSAVVRTADCFGYSEVYVLEDKFKYKINDEIAMGAQKWVITQSIISENGAYTPALQRIKNKGYKLIAATPHVDGCTPDHLDLSSPLCIALGAERHGLHPDILAEADGYVRIPMLGFTESLNVSVTAGILMYRLRQRMEIENIRWQLSPKQEKELLYKWMLRTIPNAKKMVQRWKSNDDKK